MVLMVEFMTTMSRFSMTMTVMTLYPPHSSSPARRTAPSEQPTTPGCPGSKRAQNRGLLKYKN